MNLLGAQLGVGDAGDSAPETLHPTRSTRSAVLVAVAVTGSLLVSPWPTALVATSACWLAAITTLLAGSAGPEQQRPISARRDAWWPATLRAVLTGLILTLAVLGASQSLLQGSWASLLAALVLVAAVVPWWLDRADPETRHRDAREPRTEVQTRLWQSRRRVAAATFAATVGLSGSLVILALLVVLGDVLVAGGPAPLAGHLPGVPDSDPASCGLASATLIPMVATVSALAGAAATAAAALSAHVRPTPRTDLRHLIAWGVLGAVLAMSATAALTLWWVR